MMVRRVAIAVVVCLVLVSASIQALAQDPDPTDGAPQASPSFAGLAQAPEANLFTGSASTSINIEVPPGHKGMTPRISLVYTSGAGPSHYGYGWNLQLGEIQRSRRNGTLSCSEDSADEEGYRDQYVLNLPGASVECTLAATATSGRRKCTPLLEQSFVRIYYVEADNKWLVWDKSGTKYQFGNGFDHRTGSDVTSGWTSGDPCYATASWYLVRADDTNGNFIYYDYTPLDGSLTGPGQIRYGYNGTEHLFEIDFVWQARPVADQILNATGGFPGRLEKLLDRIDVTYAPTGETVRSYDFAYDVDPGHSPRFARQSFLEAVTLTGKNGEILSREDGTPASTTFVYEEPSFIGAGFATGRKIDWPSSVSRINRVGINAKVLQRSQLMDMDGDGMVDLVDTTNCGSGNLFWDVFLGDQNGFAASATPWAVPNVDGSCQIRRTRPNGSGNDSNTEFDTLDLDGDGIPDWVDARQQPWEVYLGRRPAPTEDWGFDTAFTTWFAPVVNGQGQQKDALRSNDQRREWLDLVDWNGDGLVDIVNAREGRLHYNLRDRFEDVGTAISFPNDEFGYIDGDRRTKGLRDINGDGLPDLIRATYDGPTDVETWTINFNHGGKLGADVSWTVPNGCDFWGLSESFDGSDAEFIPPHSVPYDYTMTGRELIDVNGDGLADIVESCAWDSSGWPYWDVYLNHGNGFRQAAINWYSPVEWLSADRDALGRPWIAVRSTLLPIWMATESST